MLPAAKAVAKEMLPVVDRPTVQYVIEEAAAGGVEDVLLVTSRDKRAIEDHFDRSRELEERLKAVGKDALLAPLNALIVALSPTLTCPASVTPLSSTAPLPIFTSCATCVISRRSTHMKARTMCTRSY